jgi:starch synthase (maltosyl-transferring)
MARAPAGRRKGPGADIADGRVRAVIDAVRPSVDGGRFAIKRVVGEPVEVEAACFADGHDVLRVMLRWRAETEARWSEVEMAPLGNDVWRAGFVVPALGRYRYTVCAWVDHFRSWHHELERRIDADDIRLAARAGAELLDAAAARARGADRKALGAWAKKLRQGAADAALPADALKTMALDDTLADLAAAYPDRSLEASYGTELPLVADRERARFSSWYELFPRSTSPEPGRHGTFRDVEARLPYVAGLGFDVLYFPPIHPIGREKRKGRNNTLTPEPGDVGSPWAIGAAEGGHTAILSELGTLEDFRRLVASARGHGLEIALDIAFQCAPDHPWVQEHPDWFRTRPDGSVQYAENPPKKYQDIYPFDFESEDWRELWTALRDVFRFWIGEGVSVFRVDNPHTKAFPFWEWCIGTLKADHPDVLFLAEAFTRPRPMYRLAKLGFSQSYTYFTWRNSARELEEYVTELTTTEVREFFRPNFWPNTPDILHADLQEGGRAAFQARFVLAATLSSNYGIYGPAFELGANTPREAGSEEYLDSEKYQQRTWDLDDPASLRGLITTVNAARRRHPALQRTPGTAFHPTGNDQLLAYSRHRGGDWVLAVVSFDPRATQSGRLDLDLAAFGLPADATLAVREILTGQTGVLRRGEAITIDPAVSPVLLFEAAQ